MKYRKALEAGLWLLPLTVRRAKRLLITINKSCHPFFQVAHSVR